MRPVFTTLILLICGFLFVGCRAARIHDSQTLTRTDSIVITQSETIRDTVIQVAADSAIIRALLECDSLGQVHIRELLEYQAGSRLRPPKINVTDNVLTATSSVDSMSIYLTFKERLEQRISTKTSDTTTEKTVEVNRPSAWQRLCCRIVWVLILAGLFLGGYKLYKLLKH